MSLTRALLALWAVTLVPRTAGAVRYEVFIEIETEEDLYDLLAEGQISEATFDALLLLHQTRIDLNEADRRELYRLPNLDYGEVDRILSHRNEHGPFGSVDELGALGLLEGRVAEALRPFVLVRVRGTRGEGVHGFLRTQVRSSGRHDRLPPASALQARLGSNGELDTGIVGTLTRNRFRRPLWDVRRQGLSVAPEAIRFELPKAYVRWRKGAVDLVAGTFRIGFGQRLTFDVTGQVTPNGIIGDFELRRVNDLALRCARGAGERLSSPCPSQRVVRVTPDFAWTNRLSGVGLGVTRLPVGPGWLQAHLWGSYQVHRALRTEIVLAGECPDPRRDDEAACNAPNVYVRQGDPRAALASAPHATIPMAFAEVLGGANASYFWADRRHLGATGYAALPRWRIDGLGFQEHARRPFGGSFGAVGVDGAFGFRRQDFFVELARSFDRQPGGGGGFGAVARSTTTLAGGELDFVARYYSAGYANPYARSVSAPDELEGLRARDEAGVRSRVALELGPKLRLQALADLWSRISRAAFGALLFSRLDIRLSSAWTLAIWCEARAAARRGLCATRIRYAPAREVRLGLQLQYRALDASLAARRRQRDLGAVFELTGRPVERLQLRFRARYDYLDLETNHRLPQVLWAYLEATLTLRDRDSLRVRYDLRAHLDERESTRSRAPNPEHWLWVEYVLRY